MKKVKVVAFLLLMAVVAGCGQSSEKNDVITVNVSESHPEKELVLQDFMDVEYILLETNDEFVTQGSVMAIGEKYILVKNWSNDGNIFVFDRKTGKGLRKINRKGQGAEEYAFINGVVLDEKNNEMFVICASTKQIFVYDLQGNFKRSFNHTKGAEYLDVFDYDKDNLIRYDMSIYYEEGKSPSKPFYHAIISKEDGSVTKEIPIPFDVVKAPYVQKGNGTAVASIRPIIPYHDDWLLVETSSDTVYIYKSKENALTPFLVKTPTKDPEILLTMGVVTDRYYFMQVIEKVFNFETRKGFPITDLMYDKTENAVFDATVLNSDYTKKQKVDMTSHPINGEIAAFQVLPAYQLVEAYENDELQGRLKEIASGLNDESNPVIMLVKSKK